MKNYIILFIIIFNTIACSDKKNEIKEFHETINVKHKNKMGISIYYQEENVKKPTIFFLSAATTDRRVYTHLYHHLVQQGYVVVGLSTQSFASDYIMNHFYDALLFGKKFCNEKGIIDETRIGLAGHSSGAGILPSLGYKLFTEDKLGENGRFIWGASPWIDFQHQKNMKLPKNTNFVTELFEDDYSTDPRIYLDMYKHINVEHKTFIMAKEGGNHQTIFYPYPRELVKKTIYEPITNLASFTFRGKNKEMIFSKKEINSKYLKIEAEGTLPSMRDYKLMLDKFRWSKSSFGCKPTPNYAPNPREKECMNYTNK